MFFPIRFRVYASSVSRSCLNPDILRERERCSMFLNLPTLRCDTPCSPVGFHTLICYSFPKVPQVFVLHSLSENYNISGKGFDFQHACHIKKKKSRSKTTLLNLHHRDDGCAHSCCTATTFLSDAKLPHWSWKASVIVFLAHHVLWAAFIWVIYYFALFPALNIYCLDFYSVVVPFCSHIYVFVEQVVWLFIPIISW